MPSSALTTPVRTGLTAAARRRQRPGITLAIMLCAQLMIVLDLTVVNIALPSIATGLHFSAASLSWVLNAYALTFGGLLLLGGRAGDILGRRRVFLAGLALFTAASLAGGLATSAPLLLAARAVQGVGGAIATPAVLAIIVSGFPDGRERTRALALFTAVVMGGSSLGLVLGGAITEWFSWRWVLFINVPIGIAVLLIGPRYISESQRQPGRLDLGGALTSTAGMSALVYAFIKASSNGWGDPLTLAAFTAAAVLLAAFVAIETRSAQPITPLRLFADRSRAASYVVRLLLVAGMFGMFFFLTQFVQEVLGLSPLLAGLAFLPMTAVLFGVSRLAPVLLPRFGAKPLMVAGLIPAVTGMAWLGQLTAGSSYLSGVLGPMLLLGAGMGLAFVPLTMTSLSGVAPEDSGAAASLVNVTQQVGGALGLAILVTVYGSASRSAARHPLAHAGPVAQAHHILLQGMSTAFTVAAVFDLCALLVVLVAIRMRGPAAATRSNTAQTNAAKADISAELENAALENAALEHAELEREHAVELQAAAHAEGTA
jgi:EmrB/QacA subfamily drug resistance transporter